MVLKIKKEEDEEKFFFGYKNNLILNLYLLVIYLKLPEVEFLCI